MINVVHRAASGCRALGAATLCSVSDKHRQPLNAIRASYHYRAACEVLRGFLHSEGTMNDANLVIIESWSDIPLKGGCSACPEVVFDAGVLIGSKRQQELTLTAMFSVHYCQVHQPSEPAVLISE